MPLLSAPCRFRIDCPRVIAGLGVGRSLDYMIFVEAYRRAGNPLNEFRLAHLVVINRPMKKKSMLRLRGKVNSAYLGTVLCERQSEMYICRIRQRRYGFRKPSAPPADDGGQAVLIGDETATPSRDIEI